MEFTSPEGERRYAELVRAAHTAAIGLDFDGVLSPIVEDPATAHIHPDAGDTLVELSAQVRAIAVITGRPARQALALGGLEEVGNRIGDAGRELFLFGQYGNERWSSTNRRIISPLPPHGLSSFLLALHAVLRRAGAADAYIEEKGLAVAVHTRRLPDPAEAVRRLSAPLGELAAAHDLMLEPGRSVLEVRAPGMHKGHAVRTLVDEVGAGAFLFAGDDLGDIEAFTEVGRLQQEGLPTLLVCSGSDEQPALADLADVVVDGPAGVITLLRRLTAEASAVRA